MNWKKSSDLAVSVDVHQDWHFVDDFMKTATLVGPAAFQVCVLQVKGSIFHISIVKLRLDCNHVAKKKHVKRKSSFM